MDAGRTSLLPPQSCRELCSDGAYRKPLPNCHSVYLARFEMNRSDAPALRARKYKHRTAEIFTGTGSLHRAAMGIHPTTSVRVGRSFLRDATLPLDLSLNGCSDESLRGVPLIKIASIAEISTAWREISQRNQEIASMEGVNHRKNCPNRVRARWVAPVACPLPPARKQLRSALASADHRRATRMEKMVPGTLVCPSFSGNCQQQWLSR
jgi:hypothetical protein